jgi:hypothetical protein
MKYKVGDKVRIKEKLVPGERYGEYLFISTMKEHLGKEVTITEILRNEAYSINLDSDSWYWTDDMLEDIIEKQVSLTNGDLVKVIKSTLSAAKKEFIGKEYKIKDVRFDKYPYRLEGINSYWFKEEELELVKLPEVPVEEFKPHEENWFGKKYTINYLKGVRYKDVFNQGGKVSTITGKLINIDTPFTGRFFLENDNGALEIILMETVVEMREVV